MHSVLIFYHCYNKLPKIWCLKTTQITILPFWGSELRHRCHSVETKVSIGQRFLLEAPGLFWNPFPCPSASSSHSRPWLVTSFLHLQRPAVKSFSHCITWTFIWDHISLWLSLPLLKDSCDCIRPTQILRSISLFEVQLISNNNFISNLISLCHMT